jgi:hypothetical protein
MEVINYFKLLNLVKEVNLYFKRSTEIKLKKKYFSKLNQYFKKYDF